MWRLEQIISPRAADSPSDVYDGGPPLQRVVAGDVKNVGDPDRGARPRRFDARKQRVIIHDAVAQKNFINPTPANVQG